MVNNQIFLIMGAGYSGMAIGAALARRGAKVFGTTRNAAKFQTLIDAGITPLIFDGTMNDSLKAAMAQSTGLIQSIAPGDEDGVLNLLKHELKSTMPKLEWAAYLSTVGVYGDHDGAWVDEASECRPVSKRSHQRVKAETEWQAAADKISVPLAILRLSGIYGPGRNTFKRIEEGTARRLVKPDQVFNRIRVEDIAAATALLAAQQENGIFNITDDEPAPPQDVVTYACDLLSVSPPVEQDFATADLTPMARSFYGENKRVANNKIKQLGFVFAFPNFRVSLQQLKDLGEDRHNSALSYR